jgi:hypothetical protein
MAQQHIRQTTDCGSCEQPGRVALTINLPEGAEPVDGLGALPAGWQFIEGLPRCAACTAQAS